MEWMPHCGGPKGFLFYKGAATHWTLGKAELNSRRCFVNTSMCCCVIMPCNSGSLWWLLSWALFSSFKVPPASPKCVTSFETLVQHSLICPTPLVLWFHPIRHRLYSSQTLVALNRLFFLSAVFDKTRAHLSHKDAADSPTVKYLKLCLHKVGAPVWTC